MCSLGRLMREPNCRRQLEPTREAGSDLRQGKPRALRSWLDTNALAQPASGSPSSGGPTFSQSLKRLVSSEAFDLAGGEEADEFYASVVRLQGAVTDADARVMIDAFDATVAAFDRFPRHRG